MCHNYYQRYPQGIKYIAANTHNKIVIQYTEIVKPWQFLLFLSCDNAGTSVQSKLTDVTL